MDSQVQCAIAEIMAQLAWHPGQVWTQQQTAAAYQQPTERTVSWQSEQAAARSVVEACSSLDLRSASAFAHLARRATSMSGGGPGDRIGGGQTDPGYPQVEGALSACSRGRYRASTQRLAPRSMENRRVMPTTIWR